MESELQNTVHSPVLEKKQIVHVLEALTDFADKAGSLRDEEFVENPELRRALSIVESFLRKKHCICYGGMAINAHLPSELKFYDFSKTLPDYDFFTYDPEKDSKELASLFRSNGYTEVESRLGTHKGTYKIFVNYVGVADITEMPYWMYTILQKRSIQQDGISYADSDFLRMNMYLELSRPRGEVERLEKVYKRLILLNMAKPTHTSHCEHTKRHETIHIGKALHELLLQYVASNQLIFAGAELKRIYSNPKTLNNGFLLKSQHPILVYSKNPDYHIPIVRQMIHNTDPSAPLKVVHWPRVYEGFPEIWGIQKRGQLVFLAIDEMFCNSYNTVNLPNNISLRILSLDGAITLFYMLTFLRGLDGIVPNSIHCFADTLVDISRSTRDKGKPGVYPLFVLSCHGHQETKASLLRAKRKRVLSLKRKNVAGKSKTLKQYRN